MKQLLQLQLCYSFECAEVSEVVRQIDQVFVNERDNVSLGTVNENTDKVL